VLELMLAHPYTGSWVGYTTRLLHDQITGVCPLWMHIGHVHALAAAAAIRAGLDFQTRIPLWQGGAIIPTLGMARLAADSAHSVAEVRGQGGQVEIRTAAEHVRLPDDLASDGPRWWGMRRLVAKAGGRRLAVRLDDLDPYRGIYEPVSPQRLSPAEVNTWRVLLDGAWALIVRNLPDLSRAIPAGLDSLVPRPAVAFGNLSASTGETFGSAIIARPSDAALLAATLVHEFQHIRLDGLLHLTPLHDDDARERFYTPWRDDPRPIGGVLQGVYAFFGVTEFWRALASSRDDPDVDRAAFEFAHWRAGTWRTLQTMRDDEALLPAGRRFVDGIAGRLGPWQDEPVPADVSDLAAAVAADHYAGWRIRFLRPSPRAVTTITIGWLAGRRWPVHLTLAGDQVPTPVPDGPWAPARAELVRLRLTEPGRSQLAQLWPTVPGATAADYAYVSGRQAEAVRSYRAELAVQPDRPASWIGLGLALSAQGRTPAAHALLRYPELVRAVHRLVRAITHTAPAPDELAAWIGRFVP
jgi:HEXXH motif-containing protein